VLYYVMPYVAGESLRERLNRERQLPLEDVVAIARDVASGLQHAHSRGVVHRDIKPENILLHEGQALIADFGIARALTVASDRKISETGISLGTPAYMSPEQAGGDPATDARSDIYSLGCLLYELLVGHPPFGGQTAQEILARHMIDPVPSIRAVRTGVPEAVEAAVVKALAKAPADRHQSAETFATALGAAVAGRAPEPARRRRSRTVVAAVATGVSVLALLAYWLGRPAPLLGFAAHDWVVVAEFQHGPDQDDVARALNLGLSVGLQQSRHINVLSRTRIATVLEFMKRPPNTIIDEATAREIAQRVGAKAVVVPELAAAGAEFLISLRVIEPVAGDVVASFAQRAAHEGDLLNALDALLAQLRRGLGESFMALRREPGLPAVTTGSIEALKRYAAARSAWHEGRYNDGLALFQEAIALDSAFASAYAALGNAYASYIFHDLEKARVSFDGAITRLNRVTMRERYVIQALYQGYFGRAEEAIRYYGLHLDRYPDDIDIRYNLAGQFRALSDCEQAIAQYREVLRLDPEYAGALVNIATCLPHPEAMQYWQRAQALRPNWFVAGNLNHEFGMAYASLGQLDSARAVFERRLAQTSATDRANAHRSLGQLELLGGHLARARVHFAQAVPLHRESQEPASMARDRMWLAIGEVYRGDTAAAARALHQAAVEMPLTAGWLVLRARLARTFVLAGALQPARAMSAEFAAWARDHEAPKDGRVEVQLLEADLLVAQGRADSALLVLAPIEAEARWDEQQLDAIARAYEGAQRWVEAAAKYRLLIEREAISYEGLVPWIVAYYHLGMICERLGERADAVRAYQRFVELWGEADPEVQPRVADARRRIVQLGSDAPP
jgi:serine/threonine-protein kinase